MARRIAAAAAAIALFLCGALPARATEPFARVGTYAMGWLGFPLGVRNIGMGATGTADVSGLSTGYFNPAGMAFTDATTVTGSYEVLYLHMALSQGVISTPIPIHSRSRDSAWRFGGAASYSRFTMGTEEHRTIFLPQGTGTTYDISEWMLSSVAAAAWTYGVFSASAGGAAKFLRSNLAESVDAWSFDAGATASCLLNHESGALLRPRVGYAKLNLDNGATYDGREFFIATENRIGIGVDIGAPLVTFFDRDVHLFSLAADYDFIDREGYSTIDYSAGIELTGVDMVHFRYGAIDDGYTTYGVGLGWDDGRALLRVDYAHAKAKSGSLLRLVGPEADRDTFGMLIGVRW